MFKDAKNDGEARKKEQHASNTTSKWEGNFYLISLFQFCWPMQSNIILQKTVSLKAYDSIPTAPSWFPDYTITKDLGGRGIFSDRGLGNKMQSLSSFSSCVTFYRSYLKNNTSRLFFFFLFSFPFLSLLSFLLLYLPPQDILWTYHILEISWDLVGCKEIPKLQFLISPLSYKHQLIRCVHLGFWTWN